MIENAQDKENATSNGQDKATRSVSAVAPDLKAGASEPALQNASEAAGPSIVLGPVPTANMSPLGLAAKPRKAVKSANAGQRQLEAASAARGESKRVGQRNAASKRVMDKSAGSPQVEVPKPPAQPFRQSAMDAKDLYAMGAFAWQDSARELQQTMLHFAQANISAGFGFIGDIMSQRDPVKIASLQQSFLRDGLITLSRQMREVSRLSGRVAGDALKPMQEGFTQVSWRSVKL